MLRENKRLKTPEDKAILRQFKDDVFNESIPVAVIIKKYFKLVNDIKTTYNVAYRNSTCEDVAEEEI